MSHAEEDKLSDPKVVGPGGWYAIHRIAMKAKALEKKEAFIEFMIDFCDNFKCLKCRGHCQEYIKNNPITDYMNVKDEKTGEDIGMFKWSFIFHNAVNTRLGKPFFDWATARNLYTDADFAVCTKDCEETEKPSVEEISKKSNGLIKIRPAQHNFTMVTFNK